MPPEESDLSAVERVDDPDLEASFDEVDTEAAEDVFAALHATIRATRVIA